MKNRLIRLDKYLLEKGLAESRSVAQSYIEQGRVTVNGQKTFKAASQVGADADIKVDMPGRQWVSRGAYKLLKALDSFALDPAGLICLDIGASTGGFTEVLLTRGAAKVFAVDVGYGQLAWKLRSDPRVVVLERTNARYLTGEMLNGQKADIIVCDASFISLKLLLGTMSELLGNGGRIVSLVKPQFEAGRERVGKGVITDPAIHLQVLRDVAEYAESKAGLVLLDVTFSPIRGPEGNLEFLFEMAVADEAGCRAEIDFAAVVAAAHRETAAGVQKERDNE